LEGLVIESAGAGHLRAGLSPAASLEICAAQLVVIAAALGIEGDRSSENGDR
jgi:hypothetical protein